ncbi:MAG: hypothetical protein IIX95_08325, partial [Clostridiales bacterium]|nr:hypothetical protein [Clostridiales bacterium]
MRDEKKYEILPGVELPDYKTIKAAASDFSVSDVGDELDKMYLNREIAQDLYNEAVDTPGRLRNYGCGLAQFLSLRYRAEDTLGDDFDPAEYNRVLLTYGDRDFEVVESDL